MPSPTATIPQNDFLIVLHDSIAYDNGGNIILEASVNRIFNPSTLASALVEGDTLSVVSFS